MLVNNAAVNVVITAMDATLQFKTKRLALITSLIV